MLVLPRVHAVERSNSELTSIDLMSILIQEEESLSVAEVFRTRCDIGGKESRLVPESGAFLTFRKWRNTDE